MCLIVTIVMFVLAIQNFMQGYLMMAALQLMLTLVFAFLLWRNIQLARCDRGAKCNTCTLPLWLTNIFKKKEQ